MLTKQEIQWLIQAHTLTEYFQRSIQADYELSKVTPTRQTAISDPEAELLRDRQKRRDAAQQLFLYQVTTTEKARHALELKASEPSIFAYLWLISRARPDALEEAVNLSKPQINENFFACIPHVEARLAQAIEVKSGSGRADQKVNAQPMEFDPLSEPELRRMMLLIGSAKELSRDKSIGWDQTAFAKDNKDY